jgi:hypothetical protein
MDCQHFEMECVKRELLSSISDFEVSASSSEIIIIIIESVQRVGLLTY